MNAETWFVDTIHRATLTGVSAAGEASYSSPLPIKCRFERKRDVVSGADGVEVAIEYKFATATAINATDMVWPPGANTASTGEGKRPVTIEQASTKTGAYTLYQVTL